MDLPLKPTVSERFRFLCDSEELCDVEFSLYCFDSGKAEKVKGHRLLFAVASPVFRAMLFGNLAENSVIEIPDIEFAAFKTMKRYIYWDDIVFESAIHAVEVYKCADKYNFPHLLQVSEEYILNNIEVNNVIEILEYCENNKVEYACMEFIKQHTAEVITTEGFLESELSTLDLIVDQEELCATEIELFMAVNKWIEHFIDEDDLSFDTARPALNIIINKIRFLCMTPEEFIEGVSECKLISSDDALSILAYIVKPESVEIPSRYCISKKTRDGNLLTWKNKKIVVCWKTNEHFLDEIEKKCLIHSSVFYLNDFVFHLHCEKKVLNGEIYLCIVLMVRLNGKIPGENWSLEVSYCFTLSEPNDDGRKKSTSYTFNQTQNQCELEIIKFSDLINPDNNYVNVGVVTFYVEIEYIKFIPG